MTLVLGSRQTGKSTAVCDQFGGCDDTLVLVIGPEEQKQYEAKWPKASVYLHEEATTIFEDIVLGKKKPVMLIIDSLVSEYNKDPNFRTIILQSKSFGIQEVVIVLSYFMHLRKDLRAVFSRIQFHGSEREIETTRYKLDRSTEIEHVRCKMSTLKLRK